MLRLLRSALLVIMAFVVLSFVMGIGTVTTGPIEKAALAAGIIALVAAAPFVHRIGAGR